MHAGDADARDQPQPLERPGRTDRRWHQCYVSLLASQPHRRPTMQAAQPGAHASVTARATARSEACGELPYDRGRVGTGDA